MLAPYARWLCILTLPMMAAAQDPSPGRPVYSGAVRLSPDSGTLDARWTIQLAPRGGGPDSVAFLLNYGLSVKAVTGPRVSSFTDTLLSDRRRITVRYRGGAGPVAIVMEYAGKPKLPTDSINSLNPAWIELALDSHWLPVVADYGSSITGTVRVALPGSWDVVAAGTAHRDGSATLIEQTVPLIDIPWAAAPRLRSRTAGRTTVYDVHSPDSVVTRVAATARSCVDHLEATYASSLPPLRIVLAPRNGPGYARKNYIVITPSANISPRGLTRFICHEVAHFWATGAISSGPDNWINEGFAEFISARAVRALVGQAAYDTTAADWGRAAADQPAIWTGPAGRRPGPRVSYAKAPFLLHRLEERIGAPTMDRFLQRFLTGTARTTPAVVELLRDVAGDAQADWFSTELSK